MRGLMWRAATLVMLLLGTAGCADSLSGMSGAGDVKGTGRSVTVQPREIDEVLDNPGMGFADFHFGFGHPPAPEEYPHPTVAYFRWPWAELEPKEGQYNFALVDRVI